MHLTNLTTIADLNTYLSNLTDLNINNARVAIQYLDVCRAAELDPDEFDYANALELIQDVTDDMGDDGYHPESHPRREDASYPCSYDEADAFLIQYLNYNHSYGLTC